MKRTILALVLGAILGAAAMLGGVWLFDDPWDRYDTAEGALELCIDDYLDSRDKRRRILQALDSAVGNMHHSDEQLRLCERIIGR